MFYALWIIQTLHGHWLHCVMGAFITRERLTRASITFQGCPSPSHSLKESLEASKTELSSYQSPRMRTPLHSDASLKPLHSRSHGVPLRVQTLKLKVIQLWIFGVDPEGFCELETCGRLTAASDERLPNWYSCCVSTATQCCYVATQWPGFKGAHCPRSKMTFLPNLPIVSEWRQLI